MARRRNPKTKIETMKAPEPPQIIEPIGKKCFRVMAKMDGTKDTEQYNGESEVTARRIYESLLKQGKSPKFIID